MYNMDNADQNYVRRRARLNSSPDSIQELYRNLELGGKIGEITEKISMDEHLKRELINVVGDTILGFYSPADFVKNIMAVCRLNEETAFAVQNELKPYLDMITALYTPPSNPLSPQNLQQSAIPQITSSQTTQKPLTREEVLQALSPQRTMAGDIQSARRPEPPAV